MHIILTTRNERFTRGFLSFEKLVEGKDLGKISWISDGGKGAEAIRLAAETGKDRTPHDPHRDRIAQAARHLRRTGRARLVPVLLLIFKYGRRRQHAIEDLMQSYGLSYDAAKKRYLRHRSILIGEFVPNRCY